MKLHVENLIKALGLILEETRLCLVWSFVRLCGSIEIRMNAIADVWCFHGSDMSTSGSHGYREVSGSVVFGSRFLRSSVFGKDQ